MKALLSTGSAVQVIQPITATATERKATLRVELPNPTQREMLAIELTLPDLLGLVDLINIVKRDGFETAADRLANAILNRQGKR